MEDMSDRSHRWDGRLSRYVTDLTNKEKSIVDKIDLGMWPPPSKHHEVCQANEQPILALLSSLTERHGVPEQRWNYWSSPAYRIGRGKGSCKDVFEAKGSSGDDAYAHAHFIPYLRYFLFGAYLPSHVIEEFEEKVGNPEWVTSGDVVPIGTRARDLTKQYSLNRDGAALEFFKLCLDIGLTLSVAKSVRHSVMQLRSTGALWRW